MNKKLLVTAFAFGFIIAGAFGISAISAQDTTTSPHDSIINRLVERFGLNRDEVTKVFVEEREARQTEMQKRMEERLSQAVTDGKITEEQKQKILEKHEEMQVARQNDLTSFQNMTMEERHEAMETKREELETWAEENNIPLEYFRFKMMRGGMNGSFHMGFAQ